MSSEYRIVSKTVLEKDKFKIQKKWLHLFWINYHGTFPHIFDTLEEATLKVQELIDEDSSWETYSTF